MEKRWSVAVSDLECQLCAMREKHFFLSFFAYYGVWNGGLTESTASAHYLHRVLDYEQEM